jgi:hypothetical protein
MEQWTYWVEKVTLSVEGSQHLKLADVNRILNESGREGWELISMVQVQPHVLLAFFKRKLVI